MTDKLVFDVGVHTGLDTAYYLSKGYRVVGIDADRGAIGRASELFAPYVASGRLTLVNCAVSDRDGQMEFHISNNPLWSSLRKGIADRKGMLKETVTVPSVTLGRLMREHGVPYYCKVDIEGYDAVCLKSLAGFGRQPEYISVETECADDSAALSEQEALDTLAQLRSLGYARFKLVDQESLAVLGPRTRFYGRPAPLFPRLRRKIRSFLGIVDRPNRELLSSKLAYQFAFGSTGPFGEDLQGGWLDFETATRTLLFHRRSYFALPSSVSYGFWCDWHAGP